MGAAVLYPLCRGVGLPRQKSTPKYHSAVQGLGGNPGPCAKGLTYRNAGKWHLVESQVTCDLDEIVFRVAMEG